MGCLGESIPSRGNSLCQGPEMARARHVEEQQDLSLWLRLSEGPAKRKRPEWVQASEGLETCRVVGRDRSGRPHFPLGGL